LPKQRFSLVDPSMQTGESAQAGAARAQAGQGDRGLGSARDNKNGWGGIEQKVAMEAKKEGADEAGIERTGMAEMKILTQRRRENRG
jgi:hypothetical protein